MESGGVSSGSSKVIVGMNVIVYKMHRFSSHKNLRESIRYTFKRYAPTDTPKVGKREGKGSSLLCQIIQEEKELTRTLLATVKRPLHFCTCIPALPSQAGGSNAPFTRSKLV